MQANKNSRVITGFAGLLKKKPQFFGIHSIQLFINFPVAASVSAYTFYNFFCFQF
jgi:hypothetical protein